MGNENKELTEANQVPVLHDTSNAIGAIMMNPALLEQAMEMAKQMASAKVTVPKHLQGEVGDCYAIVLQSIQWKLSPFVVAQKTHIVNGNLGYEAQLIIAVVQASGAIKGAFKYEWEGDGMTLKCRAGAIIKGEQEITWNSWLLSVDVKVKNSPLWKTNPRQQIGYLQAKNWARLYCPGAILGVYSSDELQDNQADYPPQSNENVIELITDEQEMELHAMITENGLSLDDFKRHIGVDKLSELISTKYQKAKNILHQAINAKANNGETE